MTFNRNQKTHIILLPDIVELCFVINVIHAEIYAPKSIKIKIVSSRKRSQLIGHTIYFTSEKRRIDALIGFINVFSSEQNLVARSLARSPLLLTNK